MDHSHFVLFLQSIFVQLLWKIKARNIFGFRKNKVKNKIMKRKEIYSYFDLLGI